VVKNTYTILSEKQQGDSEQRHVAATRQLRSQLQYVGVSKSFRTGRLEQELQMVQLSATRCSCIAIL
jgi:hypothetical protein